jgi:hypothetical protein
LDGTGNDIGYSVATDSVGNVYITGDATSDVQLDLRTYFGGAKPGGSVGTFLLKYFQEHTIKLNNITRTTGNKFIMNIDSRINLSSTYFSLYRTSDNVWINSSEFPINLVVGNSLNYISGYVDGADGPTSILQNGVSYYVMLDGPNGNRNKSPPFIYNGD